MSGVWERCCLYNGYWGGLIDMCSKGCNGFRRVNYDIPEELKRCINYDICGMTVPESYLIQGMCCNCAITFERKVEKVISRYTCPACLKIKEIGFLHPSCHQHLYCVDCIRFLFSVTNNFDIEPDPRKYGCEECPHKKAPIWCRTLECQEMLEEWRLKRPEEHERWSVDTSKVIDEYDYYTAGTICFKCGKGYQNVQYKLKEE